MKEREGKSKRSKSHHHRAGSPDRKKYRDDHTPSSLAESLLSPESSLGTATPEMDVEAQGKSSSRHRHHHKRRNKMKRRHRERSEDRAMDVELEGRQHLVPGEGRPGDAEEREGECLSRQDREMISSGGENKEMEANDEIQRDTQEIKSSADEVADSAPTDSNVSNLVPYQDSSTTEVEEETSKAATGGNQSEVGTTRAAADQANMETEPAMKMSAVVESSVDNHVDELGKALGEEEPVEEAGKGEEPNENEPAEDSLMISLHVDDTIDGAGDELLDEECSTTLKAGNKINK